MRSRWLDIGQILFCVFMDRDEVEVHKHAKRERGQYPSHVQYCQIDSIRQNNILFVVDRKIALIIREKWTKCCRFDRFVRFVKWKSSLSIRQVRSSIGQLHLISDNGDPVQDCRIDRFVRLVGIVISFTIPH